MLQALPEDDDDRRTDLLFGNNENLIGFVLEHIGWSNAHSPTRRALTYDTVERIQRLLTPTVDGVLAEDVLSGISDNVTDDESFDFVRQAIAQMRRGAASLVDEALDTRDELTTDPVYLMRLRLAVRHRI